MWRATIKGLLAHKLRLALTGLAIVLGVSFVAGTYILTDTLNRTFDELFATVNKGVAVSVQGVPKFESNSFGQDAGMPERVPASLVDEIKAVPGVRTAEGTLTGYAQLVVDGKAVSTGGAPTLGVSTIEDPGLSSATVRDGRRPQREGEIAVDAATARKHDIAVGDHVTVLLQGPPMEATVVGIFGFGEADNLGGATIVGFDPATAQKALNGGGKYDTIDVAADPGVSPNELKSAITRILPQGVEAKTGEEAAADNADQIKQALSFFNIALLVFAFVAVIVGVFLIVNTFQILVSQRTRELALLRTLGATAKQVRRSVVLEALVLGLVMSAVGLGFGIVIAVGLQALLRAFGIDLPSTSLQILPRTVIVAFVVGVGATLVASISPARRAARIAPMAALRDAEPSTHVVTRGRVIGGALTTLAGAASLTFGLLGGSLPSGTLVAMGAVALLAGLAWIARGGFAYRRARRAARADFENDLETEKRRDSARKTMLVGLWIALGGLSFLNNGISGTAYNSAAVVGLGALLVFIGIAMLAPLIASPVARFLGAPLGALFGIRGRLGRENAVRNPKRTASTSSALMIGVGLIGMVTIFGASIKASTAAALEETLKADYIVTSTSFQGFSQDVADQMRARPEFTSVTQLRAGLMGVKGGAEQVIGTDPGTLTQVASVEMVAGSVSDLDDDGLLLFKDVADKNGWKVGDSVPVEFSRTGERDLTVVGVYADDRLLGNYVISLPTFDANFTEQLDIVVLAKTAPGVSQAQAKQAATAITDQFPNVKLEDQAQFRASQAQQIDQLLGLITALLGLALFIAAVGIWNTLALSIYERTREIGLLRAVGMARRQVRAMIRWEAVIVAVFGALLGIAVGLFFGWALVQALSSSGIDHLSVPVVQLVAYVVIAGLIGVVAALVPAWQAGRLNVLRAISTE